MIPLLALLPSLAPAAEVEGIKLPDSAQVSDGGAALVLGCGPALATTLFPEAMRARALAAYAATLAGAIEAHGTQSFFAS